MKKKTLSTDILPIVFMSILLSLLITPAGAYDIENTDTIRGFAITIRTATAEYRVDLNPYPAEIHKGPYLEVLEAAFPGWTFLLGWPSGTEPPGHMYIRQYDAVVGKVDGIESWYPPNRFRVEYVSGPGGPGLPAGWRLQWIQFVRTNRPRAGAPADTPYVDPTPNDDDAPFYHSRDEIGNNSYMGEHIYDLPNTDIRFLDRPRRGFEDDVRWEAYLYLVAWDQNSTVYIPFEGIWWGFTIRTIGPGGPIPPGVPNYNVGGVGGDKEDEYIANASNYGYIESGVGGVVIPVDKLALLAPYIALASTTIIAAVATVVYVKRVKRRRENQ